MHAVLHACPGSGILLCLVAACLDGGQDGSNVVDGAPLVLQDVQADAAVRIHCAGSSAGDRVQMT